MMRMALMAIAVIALVAGCQTTKSRQQTGIGVHEHFLTCAKTNQSLEMIVGCGKIRRESWVTYGEGKRSQYGDNWIIRAELLVDNVKSGEQSETQAKSALFEMINEGIARKTEYIQRTLDRQNEHDVARENRRRTRRCDEATEMEEGFARSFFEAKYCD
ncbi:MAG: hypothetical protein ISP41_15610 [Alphaproteobacteria bacterium]|nr:hypothetical protein [Alphaproteobacteria bacterium]